jgi:hypothetical protein
LQEYEQRLLSSCIFFILASGNSTIIVNASGQTNTLQIDNDEIYSSPDESSQTVISLENETSVAPVIEQVQVTNLTTVNQTNRPEEFPSVRVDSMPEEEEAHTAEKNTSQALKTSTKVLSIPPPTPSRNTSYASTPSINTSSIFYSNITNNSTNDYSGINSSGISHNSSGISHNTSLVRTVSGFDGLGSNDTCKGCLPPDVHIAVGRDHLVQTINGAIGFWSKNGTYITAKDLNELFNVSSGSITSDPSVLYDNVTDRWLASILDATNRSVRLAVSITPDPLGSWNITNFPFTGVNSSMGCPDRPVMGISDDKLVISSNLFWKDNNGRCPYDGDGAEVHFMGVQFVVVDKNDLVSEGILQYKSFEDRRSSFFPVKSFTPRSELLLVSVGDDTATRLSVITIEGDAPDDLILIRSRPNIQTSHIPPNAIQPNTNVRIHTGDARVLDAVASSNEVWITFNDACTPSGDTLTRSCFRLLHLDLDNGSLIQDFDVGFKGSYFFYPALAVDTQKNLFAIFGYSSSTIFPSLAIIRQSVGSELNTITSSFLIRRGENENREGDLIPPQICDGQNPCARFGDYFSATIDPLNPSTIWVAGEYYKEPTYSTYIASIS